MSVFLDVYDFKFKSEKDIPYEKKVTGFPLGIPFGKVTEWERCYLIDEDQNLWSGNKYINFWVNKYTNDEVKEVLNLQDTKQQIQKIIEGKEYTYSLGEIHVEALVRYHEDDFYYSCLNTKHKHNSLGEIVGIKVLNFENLFDKYKYRYKTHERYWNLYPDNIIADRVNKNGILVKTIKDGDIFYQVTSIGRQKVRVEGDELLYRLPLVPDMPDRKVWVEIVDLNKKAAKQLGIESGYSCEVNSLFPLDAPPKEPDWAQQARKEYEKTVKRLN